MVTAKQMMMMAVRILFVWKPPNFFITYKIQKRGYVKPYAMVGNTGERKIRAPHNGGCE